MTETEKENKLFWIGLVPCTSIYKKCDAKRIRSLQLMHCF